MTRTLSTALLALTISLGAGLGAATAQDSQLRASAGNTLDHYGFTEVDPTLLSDDQLVMFNNFDSQDFVNDAEASARIDQILLMNAVTAPYVSDEMTVIMQEEGQPQLRNNARTLLERAGYDPAIAEQMTVQQLAEMWFIDDTIDDEELRRRVQVLLES